MATRRNSDRSSAGPQLARFHSLAPHEAEGKAGELLSGLAGRHGQVGTMVATMAHSPAVLAGYLDLSRAMKRAQLDRTLSERVSIAVQAGSGARRASTPTWRPPAVSGSTTTRSMRHEMGALPTPGPPPFSSLP